jgi:hypothetical protein
LAAGAAGSLRGFERLLTLALCLPCRVLHDTYERDQHYKKHQECGSCHVPVGPHGALAV